MALQKTHTQIMQSITKVLKQSEVANNVKFFESVMRFLIIFSPNKTIKKWQIFKMISQTSINTQS